MRRFVGWFLALLGAAALALGAVVAGAFGPDDTLVLGPHRMSATGPALVTAPRVVPYAGPTLRVTATLDDPTGQVFVGFGQDVNVRDYLDQTAYTRVDKVSLLPWRAETTEVQGSLPLVPDPEQLSWWFGRAAGAGSATAAVPLPDAPVDVVILQPTATSGFGVDVIVSVVQDGSFVGGLATLLAGVGLIVVGLVLVRRRGADSTAVPR